MLRSISTTVAILLYVIANVTTYSVAAYSALAEATQAYSRQFEQWNQLNQERCSQLEIQLRFERKQIQRELEAKQSLAQEQMRQKQDMSKDLINTLKNKPYCM